MEADIIHYRCEDEANVIREFLMWQGCDGVGQSEDIESLKVTKGVPGCVVNLKLSINSGHYTIIGFKQLYKFWNEKGLWLI